MQYTSMAEVLDTHSTLWATFATGRTKELAWRLWQLKQLWWLVDENQDALLAALRADLGRHDFESHATDLSALRRDLLNTLANLPRWAADERVPAGGGGTPGWLLATTGHAHVRREPLGVALIIGAWNFPVLLVLQPLVAALAAGNCVVLKPSELAPACQQLLQELVPRYMDAAAVRVVTGGARETAELLTLRFAHIFFTGSTAVARHIAAAAAKHLTPTVLELGGQAPAVVSACADVSLAAKRVAYAKFMNAGQICLSVNHVLVDPAVHDEFVRLLAEWFDRFLPARSQAIVRIVNERHWDRVASLLDRTAGTVVYGGHRDRAQRFIQPCIVTGVQLDDALMSEELFGPIVPVLKMELPQACATIASLPHPLAIYMFSNNQAEVDEVLSKTTSGGVTVNDVIMHATLANAPFGGVGESGHGYYHGKYGFLAFSHMRTVVSPPLWLEKAMGLRYPPFDIANVARLAVGSSVSFKKGETLEDQRRACAGSAVRWMARNAVVVGVLALAVVLAGRQEIVLPGVLRLFERCLSLFG